jgi:DNA/RNA-binding domain of Phe-tRNA-synthetase-like protein
MSEFRQFLTKESIAYTEPEFRENEEWIVQQLRREIFINIFNIDDSRRIMVESDPMVLKAIEGLPKAKELLDNAKKMIVQRLNRPGRD